MTEMTKTDGSTLTLYQLVEQLRALMPMLEVLFSTYQMGEMLLKQTCAGYTRGLHEATIGVGSADHLENAPDLGSPDTARPTERSTT